MNSSCAFALFEIEIKNSWLKMIVENIRVQFEKKAGIGLVFFRQRIIKNFQRKIMNNRFHPFLHHNLWFAFGMTSYSDKLLLSALLC